MEKNTEKGDICLKHGCSFCCNPVKMRRGFSLEEEKLKKTPFKFKNEMLVSEDHPDTVKVEGYECDFFDRESGKCLEYEGRPDICKKTSCQAFETENESEQREIIKKINQEKFIKIK